jgi:hypothetical protein
MEKTETVTAQDTFDAVNNLKQKLEENFIQLGQLFSLIKKQKFYKKKGYGTFKECVETEFKINGTLAAKLCSVYDLYVEDIALDENALKEIGFDRLNLIKPFVAKQDQHTQNAWIDKAEVTSMGDLKEEIKQLKNKEKDTGKTIKEVLVDQYLERMCSEFNCSRKDLDFKLALYFQDADLEEIKNMVKTRQRQFNTEAENAKEAKQ